MRSDIASSIVSAYESENGVKPTYRLSIYKNRMYFTSDELDLSGDSGIGQAGGISTSPLSQDMKYDQWMDRLVTVYAHQDIIKMGTSGGATIDVRYGGAPLATDTCCRPTVYPADAALYVTYYSGGVVKRASIDRSLLMAGNPECVVSIIDLYTLGARCAVHALSETECILLYVDEGGIAVGYLNGTTLSAWPRRFMNPTVVYLDTSDDHISALNYSSAIKYGDSILVYMSRENGSVIGVEMKSDGKWSDTFDAVPSDLSAFKIANVFVAPNGTVHMCGQFQRVDDKVSFSSTHVYVLDLLSFNAKVFSLDRFTLLLQDDTADTDNFAYRYQMAIRPFDSQVFLSDAGRMLTGAPPFWIAGTASERLIIPGEEIKKIAGDPSSSYMASVVNNNEYYIDNPLIEVGNVAILELGARTETDYEYYQASQCILASIGLHISNGVRGMNIGLVPESLWKAASMTHPFYLEMQSKQSLNDDLDEFDNLYDVSDDSTLPIQLSVDLWTEGELHPREHDHGDVTDLLSLDLKELGYNDYPEIKSLPLVMNAYGWSRSGGMSAYTGGGDVPSDTNAANDDITGLIVVEREGVQSTIELTNITGDGYWPQTWYATRTGALPIAINIRTEDGIAVGDVIVKIGVRVTNPTAADKTVYYPERVEIPSVLARLSYPVMDTWKDIEYQPYSAMSGLEFVSLSDPVHWTMQTPYRCVQTSYHWGGISMIHHIDLGTGAVGATLEVDLLVRNFDRYAYNETPHEAITISFEWDNGTDYVYAGAGADVPVTVPDQVITLTNTISAQVGHIRIDTVNDQNLDMEIVAIRVDGRSLPIPPARTAKELQKVGVPKILFATKPYSTFNFSAATMCALTGENAWGGVVGLGKDGQNYIVVRASGDGLLEIAKVVDDTKVTLADTTYTPATTIWILFEHRDGDFRVFIKNIIDEAWPTTPNLTYRWQEEDGVMSQDGDLMHVGVYVLRDAPYVKTCGFNLGNAQTYLGVMPPAENFSRFTSSGTINIEGTEYTYTSLVTLPSPIRGPFQGRNSARDWSYTSDGEAYANYSVEFTNFEWLTNSANHNKYAGKIMNYDGGFGWLIAETDFKPTITTAGVLVYIRNRGRYFSDIDLGDNAGFSTKIWITGGFAGLAAVDGEPGSHAAGELAFLVSDTQVILTGFAASSGHEDATVEDLIERLLQMSGGRSLFPGDIIVASQTLNTGEWTVA